MNLANLARNFYWKLAVQIPSYDDESKACSPLANGRTTYWGPMPHQNLKSLQPILTIIP